MHDACAAAGIKAVRLFGADLGTERQKALDTVQDDPEVRGFIGSTVATGVGTTLIAATYVTFASMPWTPVLMGQAEDRTYRLGQQRDVVIIVPLIPGTIDEVVWKILEGKRETEIDVTEAVTTLQTNDAVVLTNTSLKRRVSGEPCWNW